MHVQVNAHNIEGLHYTALHTAVVNKRAEVVQILIDAGADTDAQTNDGVNRFASALCVHLKETLEVVKMLLRSRCGSTCRTDNDGMPRAFTLQQSLGRTETVRYLVGLPEVELNHRDTEKNYTALQYAVECNHTDVEQVLLDTL